MEDVADGADDSGNLGRVAAVYREEEFREVAGLLLEDPDDFLMDSEELGDLAGDAAVA